jgi:hypothetical protein
MPTPFTRPARRTLPALALALALGGLGCQINFTSGIEARDQWTRSYTLAEGGSFEILETNGRVTLEGTGGDQVTVVADRIGKGRTDEAAKSVLAAIEIKESVSTDRIVLDSTSKGMSFGIGTERRVEYTVKVPHRTRVTLRSTNGDFTVTGVSGRFSAVTTNGRVRATGLGEGAKIETTNGVITVQASGLGSGLTCETTNGVIDVTVPADVDANLSAQTTNGAVTYDGLTVTIAEKSRRRVDGSIGKGGPEIRLRTTNGAIRLRGGQ